MLNLFNKKIKSTETLFPIAYPSREVSSQYDYNKNNNVLGFTPMEDKNTVISEKVGETRHFPPAVNEWTNSVYSFNKDLVKTLPATDNLVNRLIKSYFSLTPLIGKKKSKRVEIRFRRLSMNRMLVSKAGMKHTNNKVIITVYLYNRNKKILNLQIGKLIQNYSFKNA